MSEERRERERERETEREREEVVEQSGRKRMCKPDQEEDSSPCSPEYGSDEMVEENVNA